MATSRDLARILLARAADHAVTARALLGVETVSDAIVGFHAQQAVEKALKAMLALKVIDFPLTHDLAVLMEICGEAGVPPPADLAESRALTPFGVRLRYSEAEDPLIAERSTGVEWADRAVEWARAVLADSA